MVNGKIVAKKQHKELNKSATKQREKVNVDSKKLNEFCRLWSLGHTKQTIMTTLKIKSTQYYRYIDAAEEIVDDFLLGFVDHGVVMQFRTVMDRVSKRAAKMDEIAAKMLEKVDENMDKDERRSITSFISVANQTDKLYSEMLDDTKLVTQSMKVLNKVILNNTTKKT